MELIGQINVRLTASVKVSCKTNCTQPGIRYIYVANRHVNTPDFELAV